MESDNDPTCDKCGAPITTGAMAMICPLREKCEFWPEEGIPEPFASMFQLDRSGEPK